MPRQEREAREIELRKELIDSLVPDWNTLIKFLIIGYGYSGDSMEHLRLGRDLN